jgi:hypothetical protein
MAEDKGKRFVADDGVSSVPEPVTPAGGEDKKKKGKPEEKMDAVTPAAGDKAGGVKEDADIEATDDQIEVVEEEVIEVEESIQQIIEGMDLSEEFKSKISVVFEAAVNESVKARVQKIEEELNEKLETELAEAVESKVTEIVDNLDSYLDYVVNEWMTENEVAIEAGIKVEMAESLMDGLKDLFTEHNIEIDDEKFDIVKDLEEELAESNDRANEVVNENIELTKEIASLKCAKVFEESTSDLTVTQKERLRTLAETLDTSDIDGYTRNLNTIRETFISESTSATTTEDVLDEEDEIITEEQVTVRKTVSDYASVNALVEALNARK